MLKFVGRNSQCCHLSLAWQGHWSRPIGPSTSCCTQNPHYRLCTALLGLIITMVLCTQASLPVLLHYYNCTGIAHRNHTTTAQEPRLATLRTHPNTHAFPQRSLVDACGHTSEREIDWMIPHTNKRCLTLAAYSHVTSTSHTQYAYSLFMHCSACSDTIRTTTPELQTEVWMMVV